MSEKHKERVKQGKAVVAALEYVLGDIEDYRRLVEDTYHLKSACRERGQCKPPPYHSLLGMFTKQQARTVRRAALTPAAVEGVKKKMKTVSSAEVKPLTVFTGPSGSGRKKAVDDVYTEIGGLISINSVFLYKPETYMGVKGRPLDAAGQIGFARAAAKAVDEGMYVVLATDSDYILKEINNLIMLHRLKSETFDPDVRKDFLEHNPVYYGIPGIDVNKVLAYQCLPEGGMLECRADVLGLDLPYVDSVIGNINNISNTLTLFVDDREEDGEDE